jgi:hypothetical protein
MMQETQVCDGLIMEKEGRAFAGGSYGTAVAAAEYVSTVRGICIVYK